MGLMIRRNGRGSPDGRGRPREKENSRPGPSVLPGIEGTLGERHSHYNAKGRRNGEKGPAERGLCHTFRCRFGLADRGGVLRLLSVRSAPNRRMSAASRSGSGDELTLANVARKPPARFSGNCIVRSNGIRVRIATPLSEGTPRWYV